MSCRGNTVAMPTQMAAMREELVSSRSRSRRTHSTYWYLLLKLTGEEGDLTHTASFYNNRTHVILQENREI